jgi:hypothetical protein
MKKILLLGMVVVLLTLGMVLASCENRNCPGVGWCGDGSGRECYDTDGSWYTPPTKGECLGSNNKCNC